MYNRRKWRGTLDRCAHVGRIRFSFHFSIRLSDGALTHTSHIKRMTKITNSRPRNVIHARLLRSHRLSIILQRSQFLRATRIGQRQRIVAWKLYCDFGWTTRKCNHCDWANVDCALAKGHVFYFLSLAQNGWAISSRPRKSSDEPIAVFVSKFFVRNFRAVQNDIKNNLPSPSLEHMIQSPKLPYTTIDVITFLWWWRCFFIALPAGRGSRVCLFGYSRISNQAKRW